MIHYIAMAGLHGCLPQYCASHETHEDAVGDLTQLHELSNPESRVLSREHYLSLDLHEQGNEYCEIVECDCENAEQHNDQ